MSVNHTPLLKTEEEFEKPERISDIGPALLPQNYQSNQDNTPNYPVQATPINQNDNENSEDNVNKNNGVVLVPKVIKKSSPKFCVKKVIIPFILIVICIIDILVLNIMNIKSSLSIIADILGIIFAIIFLILYYSKADLYKTWILVSFALILVIITLFGIFGFVNSFSKVISSDDDSEKKLEIEDEMIYFLIFFSIAGIREAFLLWIIFLK